VIRHSTAHLLTTTNCSRTLQQALRRPWLYIHTTCTFGQPGRAKVVQS